MRIVVYRLPAALLILCLFGLSAGRAAAAPTQERPSRGSQAESSDENGTQDPERFVVGPSNRESSDQDTGTRAGSSRPSDDAVVKLTNQEAIRLALRSIQEDGARAVLRGGQPIHIQYDFDGDSFEDLCVLTVGQDQEYLIERLSDFSRLFREDARPVDLGLRVFLQRDRKLLLLSDIDLGRKYVVDSLRKISLHRSESLPIAVAAVCLTAQGSEQEWVLFPENGRPTQFSIQESPAVRTLLEDIDGDGYLDVIKEEKAFEEGTGYETFLTWFRWNGSRFSEFRSTNVVRNLRSFLDRSRELLTGSDPDAFLSFGIDREILAGLRRRGFTDREIMAMVFHERESEPESESESGTPQPPDKETRLPEEMNAILFPQILENPFVRIANHYYVFPVSVRISGTRGDAGIFYTEIVMNSNPFRDRQFSFLPRNE